MRRFRLVRFDDWEALYRTDTGEKVAEGHSIPVDELLRIINSDCEVRSATPEFDAECAYNGDVPERLDGFPEGALV